MLQWDINYKILMRIKHLIYTLYIICLTLTPASGQTISGYIIDSTSRETLIGATIVLSPGNIATITDNNGFYSISKLHPGNYTMQVSHISYQQKNIPIKVTLSRLVLDAIKLQPTKLSIEEVSIIAVKPDQVADKEIEISHKELTPHLIQSIPTARNDLFSAIKYFPGVDKTEPSSPLYTVRGSDPGENAVLLDGVMIYNPYHSSVTSGIFNTQTIKKVDLLLGGFSAEYGGRNSSVMYITTKEGNKNKLHGEIEPSTFYSKLFLEFPAGKDASMIIAGRYYYDIPTNFLLNNSTYFYDYNISYSKRLDKRNTISLKYFESKDRTGYNFSTLYKYIGNSFNTDIYDDFTLEQENNWNNRALTAIHKLILSPGIYMRNQVYYSMHQSDNLSGLDITFDYDDEETGTSTISWNSSNTLSCKIRDMSAKSSLNIKTIPYNEIKIGGEYNSYYFMNHMTLNETDYGSFTRSPSLLALYAEDKITAGPIVFRPGIRFSSYRGEQWNYEPRASLKVNIFPGFRLKFAWGQYLQYILSMNTSEIQMLQLVDYYYPLKDQLPSKSTHYIAGIEKRISPQLLLTIDGYYKDISQTYTFDLNQELSEAYSFTDNIESGRGNAYGAELYLHGRFKKVSGWVAYTLAWANRQFPDSEINNGESYPYDYNRRHTLKTVINYQITDNFEFNTSYIFMSGIYRSIETTTQSYYTYNASTDELGYFPLYTSSDKNKAKMPPQMNLDFSIRRKLITGIGKKFADLLHADESFATVTIKNVLFLYRNVDFYYPGNFIPEYYDKYFPIGSNYLPSAGLSYTLKF